MKADHLEIRTFIENLKNEPWLGESRKWWPNALFHFSDVTNIAKILGSNRLVCRSRLGETNHQRDIASQVILDRTDNRWKDYVRLYFRPKTPMLFNTEGMRPRAQLNTQNGYCPVPVVLIFDSFPILALANSEFSDGNLSSWYTSTGNTAQFLRSINFQNVYHSGGLGNLGLIDRYVVMRSRHAEVMIPSELGLESLRSILCRSQAEFETLVHLMIPTARRTWRDKLGVADRISLFNENWTFVRKLTYTGTSFEIVFNHGYFKGPFHIRLDTRDPQDGRLYFFEDTARILEEVLSIQNPPVIHNKPLEVTITLDGCLAYKSLVRTHSDAIPF